jgi:hypothetical protein
MANLLHDDRRRGRTYGKPAGFRCWRYLHTVANRIEAAARQCRPASAYVKSLREGSDKSPSAVTANTPAAEEK